MTANENNIITAIQEAVKQTLSEAANEEIARLKHLFECRMHEVKRDVIGEIINSIDVVTSYDLACDGYTIQVNIKRK